MLRAVSPSRITATLSFCLVANLASLMTFPAVLPQASEAWGLTADEAGWIASIYFAGYAASVPILASATDRVDGRWIIAGCSLLGVVAGLAFAFLAGDFCAALVLRFIAGMALAGVHMPGLSLLSDRITSPAQGRSAAIYTSSYALGTSASYLIAGAVEAFFGWRAVFIAGAIGPLLAMVAIASLPPAAPRRAVARMRAAFAGIWQNRPFMAYVVGFAGNTWEVFDIRVWFVACLTWTLGRPGNALDLPNLALLAGLASLVGVPASLLVAELSARGRRADAIMATCVVSVATCLALAATAGGNIHVVLALLVFLQIVSFADVGTLGSGAVAHADPARRGAALSIYALAGFASGFAGPAAVGCVLGWFGGVGSEAAWTAAFLTMGLGSTVTGIALWTTRRGERRA